MYLELQTLESRVERARSTFRDCCLSRTNWTDGDGGDVVGVGVTDDDCYARCSFRPQDDEEASRWSLLLVVDTRLFVKDYIQVNSLMERRDAYLNSCCYLLPIQVCWHVCVCVYFWMIRDWWRWNGMVSTCDRYMLRVKEERNVNERFYRIPKESVIEKLRDKAGNFII